MTRASDQKTIDRVAVIGNYVPRQCGIATFTTDLCEALAAVFPAAHCFAVPVNDIPQGYAYPARVRFELEEKNITSYLRAAHFLNINNVDVVCMQHEYGIYGGPAGSHVLSLLQELSIPLVTTLHTVLENPDPTQRTVMEQITGLSDRLVTISHCGARFLREVYGVFPDKISMIPHGIPDVPFIDPNFYKDRFGVEGKLVILTFGLLSPNKGIEYVIEAMPEIIKRFDNVIFMVLGATHPHVLRSEGETYRLSLERLAREKGVDQNVRFFNRFVSLEELIEFIGAADIYITPYNERSQISSGTLAYALGAGKAVISTPYWYAEELLAEGRGCLVPFRNAEAIAERVIALLENESERHAMRKRAYLFGRDMVWPAVARQYMTCFHEAREQRGRRPRRIAKIRPEERGLFELPALNLSHLKAMTDATGILQHAVFTVPNYDEGYATDDNARALIAAIMLEQVADPAAVQATELAPRYLAFLWHAYNPEHGRFRNFLAYDRCWREECGSEDSHGRALWAVGTVIGRSNQAGLVGVANRLFTQALPSVEHFTSPRAWAYTLIAIHEYLRRFLGDSGVQKMREMLARRLMGLYERQSSSDWLWFEDRLTYSNASLPHALLLSGHGLGLSDMFTAGLRSLAWLTDIQRSGRGHFVPIGTDGFLVRGGERARFDQQPEEAYATLAACLEAYRLTNDMRWRKEARRAFAWFLGRNDLSAPLYDPTTGGCCDGLHPDRVNQNQGAESTLAFLLSHIEMRQLEAGLKETRRSYVEADK